MGHRAQGNYKLLGTYSWYVPDVAGMFLLLALLLVGTVLGSLLASPFLKIYGQEGGMEYATLISYPVMFIPPMIYAAIKSRSNSLKYQGLKLDSNHVTPLGWPLACLMVMLATLSTSLIAEPINALLPEMPEWLEETLGGLTGGNFWFNFLCVSIFAPFFEEWLCRGMVLRGLLGRKVKPFWAIIISAAFFALIHMNPWQAVPAFILGALFGYIYYRTGSLKLTMLMHFTNNTFALIIGHIESLSDYETWQDLLGQMYWIYFGVAVLIVALVMLAFKKIPLMRKSGNCDLLPSVLSDVDPI